MPLEDYWNDNRFQKKKPGREFKRSIGDNIYYRDQNGEMRQCFPSMHSFTNGENIETKKRDLKGMNVLISESGNFYYFGRKAPRILESLLCLVKKGPGHKCRFPKEVIDDFLQWIKKKKPEIYGFPSAYSLKENCARDDTCMRACTHDYEESKWDICCSWKDYYLRQTNRRNAM